MPLPIWNLSWSLDPREHPKEESELSLEFEFKLRSQGGSNVNFELDLNLKWALDPRIEFQSNDQ